MRFALPAKVAAARRNTADCVEGMARSPGMARLAWLGNNLHMLNPVLYVYTKAMPLLITPLYNAFGVPGLVALPWVMLSLEKVAYDTFTASRGHDMYTEAQMTGQNPHGEFPSGGARSWFERAPWPSVATAPPQSPTRLPRGRWACLTHPGAQPGPPRSLLPRHTARLRAHPSIGTPHLASNRRQAAVLCADRGARRGGAANYHDARRRAEEAELAAGRRRDRASDKLVSRSLLVCV